MDSTFRSAAYAREVTQTVANSWPRFPALVYITQVVLARVWAGTQYPAKNPGGGSPGRWKFELVLRWLGGFVP